MRRVAGLLVSLSLAFGAVPAATLGAAPGHTWIVTLRPDVDAASAGRALANQHGGSVGFVYQHALNGFAFRGSAAAAAALARSPQVTLVEADGAVQLDETQTSAPWGLDRLDQRALPLDGTFTYTQTGRGVTAYVIDSGIRTSHADFGGRASASEEADFVDDGRAGQDCNGHGTHVAGTIGGATYGVAKEVGLVSVRVFGCTGGSSWSTIIAAIDWVIQDATEPAVANLSLSGGVSLSADNAIRNMIASGVSAAVAAGNSGADACNYSPARVPAALTIGATDRTDTKPSWSNFGSCLDWFAPGVSITSTAHTGDTGTATKSGTSMAAPHTAGAVALYLEANPTASPTAVRDALFANSTKAVVSASSTANDDLLYTGFLNATAAPDAPPSVGVTSPQAGSTVAGLVSIAATATDDVSVANVEFLVDGGVVASDANGLDGWSGTWDTSGAANGTHVITARATDTMSQTTTSSPVSVTVANGTVAGAMSTVLTSASSGSGSSWTATVTINVRDVSNAPVHGAAVQWTWSTGSSGECTTDSTGRCPQTSSSQHKRVGSATLTIDAVTHGSLTWTDSVKSVTVFKP